MEKEFNLSEIYHGYLIHEKHVKEFIKLLKEDILPTAYWNKLDKLAGSKLI